MRESRTGIRWIVGAGLALASAGWAGAQVAPPAVPGTPGSTPASPAAPQVPDTPGVPGSSPSTPAAAPGTLPETTSPPAGGGSAPAAGAGNASATPNAPRRVRISSGVIVGNKLGGNALVYPAEARAKGISGSVVMRAIISREGRVISLQVVSGNDLLRPAAIDAVRTWTYRPYLLNGEPTEVDTTITVNFNLGPQPS